MDISLLPLVTNLFIGLFAVAPLFFILSSYKHAPLPHRKMLVYGIVLIAWGTLIFAWLSSGLTSMESTVANSIEEQSFKDKIVLSLRVWAFVFPAVTLSIGANLITQYILTSNENNA